MMTRFLFLIALIFAEQGMARERLVHGLWVWKTASVLQEEGSVEKLRSFCQSEGINEVYVSVPSRDFAALEERLPRLLRQLHEAEIRVEALLDGIDEDQPGAPREKLLEQVKGIVRFNRKHAGEAFDGIHLDIEPQQRPENKGAGNLAFLPGLVETFRAVRALADAAHMTTNADIANKMLKGTAEQRTALLSSVPRVTLMLYELNSPTDGKSTAEKTDKLRTFSKRYLEMAYAGLSDPQLASMSIALRMPDYLGLLPEMLQALDTAHEGDSHYSGWARHSYNDRFRYD